MTYLPNKIESLSMLKETLQAGRTHVRAKKLKQEEELRIARATKHESEEISTFSKNLRGEETENCERNIKSPQQVRTIVPIVLRLMTLTRSLKTVVTREESVFQQQKMKKNAKHTTKRPTLGFLNLIINQMNYGDAGRGVFKRSRSREAEQIHEPQRERDTFNNDRKKKGNPYQNYAFRARFPAYMGRGARGGGMMGMQGYKPFGTPGYSQPGPYFPQMGGGFLPDAVDGKLMGAYWNTLEKEDKDCETFADLFISAERAYSSSLIRPDDVAIGPQIMRDLKFKLNCKPLQAKERKEQKHEQKSKIAEVLEELDALFYSQD